MEQRNAVECTAQQILMAKLYPSKGDWMGTIVEAFSKTSEVWMATYFFQNTLE